MRAAAMRRPTVKTTRCATATVQGMSSLPTLRTFTPDGMTTLAQ